MRFVNNKSVRFKDSFLRALTDKAADNIIPYQWETLTA